MQGEHVEERIYYIDSKRMHGYSYKRVFMTETLYM